MNHYERLKVSQDAPAEVIRAAYRALAGKLHPDRQGSEIGPEDAMHAQMAALNTAYEVLIDPKSRREYDATLAPARPNVAVIEEPVLADAEPASARVDMEWMVPKPVSSNAMWPPNKRLMILGGAGLAVVILIMSSVIWKMVGQQQMERDLSEYYKDRPAGSHAPQVPDEPRRAVAQNDSDHDAMQPRAEARHKPSVEELARMSDEELVKVLPTLDDDTAQSLPAATKSRLKQGAGNAMHHPLDGRPLTLRTDVKLVDPLAPENMQPKRPKP